MEYELSEVSEAYLKLKTYTYYDKTDLFLRSRLVAFETILDPSKPFFIDPNYSANNDIFQQVQTPDIEIKLETITKQLNNYNDSGQFFKRLLDDIQLRFFPKKIQNSEKLPKNFVTNKRTASEYTIERGAVFADLPAELHIVTVLWLMKFGHSLDAELDKCCVGNRLVLNKENNGIIRGSALFRPYFKQYQKWRDTSISKAKQILDSENNVAFINLDLRDYFYSVHFDFKALDIKFFGDNYKNDNSLHEIFKKIHTIYTQKLIELNFPHANRVYDEHELMLPVGVLSSYILANWHLADFDKRINQKVRPAYYGRYVDDILIVLENPDFNFNNRESNDEIRFNFNEYRTKNAEKVTFDHDDANLVEKFILETFHPIVKLVDAPEYLNLSDGDQKQKVIFEINHSKGIYFQSDKTLLYFFDHEESSAAVDKLKQDIQERASEFRDFPEDDVDEIDFDSQAYHLIFDGTQTKIRTLKDYKENQYGLSVFLANRIFVALRRDKKSDKIESDKILKFFKGLNVLEYYRLWEKVFTYFLVNENPEGFIEFYKNVLDELIKLYSRKKIPKTKLGYSKICASLIEYFDLAFEMAVSLNPNFIKDKIQYLRKLEFYQNSQKENIYFINFFKELTRVDDWFISRFRVANMIRHDYVAHPLFNYVYTKRSKDFSLIDRHLKLKGELSIKQDSILQSPRTVRFWECCVYTIYERLLNNTIPQKEQERYVYCNLWNNNNDYYLDDAYQLYTQINHRHSPMALLTPEETRDNIYKIITSNEISPVEQAQIEGNEFFNYSQDQVLLREIKVNSTEAVKKVKIAFANTEVKEENIEKSLRKKPNLNSKRYSILADVLKQARQEQPDMLLFPECYLPYELLPSLAKYSAKNGIAIVTGLEHWNVNNIAYNFIVTILPFDYNGVKDALVVYRLKNHYAHSEELLIRGNGLKVPKPTPHQYDIFHWQGLYFSSFYCFELADIKHRSLFRSKVDLLIASEWNRDVNYFSNIIESLSRDIHAYIAQVNTCQYGDSRLTQPKESVLKDILKLKGGKNHTVLIGEIDLELLREFQIKYFELTKDDKSGYKPLPPDFERKYVKKRIDNHDILGNS